MLTRKRLTFVDEGSLEINYEQRCRSRVNAIKAKARACSIDEVGWKSDPMHDFRLRSQKLSRHRLDFLALSAREFGANRTLRNPRGYAPVFAKKSPVNCVKLWYRGRHDSRRAHGQRTIRADCGAPQAARDAFVTFRGGRPRATLSDEMNTASQQPSPLVPEEISVIGGYARAIARALEHKGVDSARAMRAAGLPESVSNDPLERLSTRQVTALYRVCVDMTHDPYFGLTVARFIHVSNVHALGYALMASRTLLDFCLRLERYFAIISQAAVLRVEHQEPEVSLRFRRQTSLCGETEDAFLAFVLRFMRLLYGKPLRPTRIELHHACPAPGPGPYTQEFGVAPVFDRPETTLVFATAALEEPLSGACPDLAEYNDRIAAQSLARLNRSDVVVRVRAVIIKRLATGDISRRQVARELGMSEALLHMKLAERSASFQDLLSDTRREMSMGYLSQRHLTITEITFLLGFTDPSNFTRAFRRWMGVSPTRYRAGQAETE